MLAIYIVFYVLLGVSLAFALVELGLSAYVASLWGGDRRVYTWDPYQGYVYTTVHESTPGILDFIIFSACWTLLVSAAGLILPWYYSRKSYITRTVNTVLGISLIVAYFVTSVFWLACFADIEAQLGGGTSWSDYLNAVIAFAVLLWLIFLALFILAILCVCGVLYSDWAGHQSMKEYPPDPEQPQTTTVSAPANDVPMSTAPAPAPAAVAAPEPSHHHAVASHNQPPAGQMYNTSSPSAMRSAELSADSRAHDDEPGAWP